MKQEDFMHTDTRLIPGSSKYVPSGETQAITAGEDVIHLDEDLFPWDGSDDLEEYVDVYGERHANGFVGGYSTEPAWRRIERYKEQQRLRTQLADIR
jgi:hypothetical protein